jgi:EmrB/QacA subfamily drug resistance transporter
MFLDSDKDSVGLHSLPRKQLIITLIGVMLAMFMGSLDQTIVGTAMPRIVSDLGGFRQYTWITTIYIITSAIAIPITGKLTDMYGRKYFYIAGLVIFVLSSLLCGLSNLMTLLIIWRGLQGIGGGMMMANAFTVIGDLFPPAERGKYQGLMSANFAISSIIGPILGGFITDTISWHWVFFVNVPIGVAIISLFIFYFPHIKPETTKHRIDYMGVIILILAVVPLMLALSWGGSEYQWNSSQIIGLFAFSMVMLILFIWIEKRVEEPIIPLGLFRNQIVTVSIIIAFLTSFIMFGGITFIPLFFQGVLGVTATTSGSLLIPMTLGTAAGSFISGQFLSRAGGHYRVQAMFGLGIVAIGTWFLSRMTLQTSYTQAMVNMVITGFGLGITMPIFTISVQNAVPYNMLGVATSSVPFFRSLGGSVGLAIIGSIMNNRFSSQFFSSIPETIKKAIPAEQLTSLAHNPQALVNAQAQAQLRDSFNIFGSQGQALFEQLLQTLRQSLSSAIARVFLIGFFIVIISFITSFFLKEIPLLKKYNTADPVKDKKQEIK